MRLSLTIMSAARIARRIFLAAALLGLAGPAAAQNFAPRDETPDQFPAAPSRDEAFYTCTACHNFKLVAQQGMNRRRWNESIDLMVAKHGMPPLEDKERAAVLDYLEAAFPERAPANRGFQNPFLNR